MAPAPMQIPDIVEARQIPPAQLHQAFVAAFADYLIGPFQVPLEGWPVFLARQAAELDLSRVALLNGDVLAFALTARRHDAPRWRLATMGALPAARGSGAAAALLDDFIARAAAAGQSGVELEVFAQNQRAHRLYGGRGFQARHELYGYRRGSAGFGGRLLRPQAGVLEVERSRALAWLEITARQIPQLPLQVTAAALPPAWLAWQQGQAQLLFSGNPPQPLTIHSLIDRDPAQQDAQALLEALLAAHPLREIQVPQLQRQDVGGAALQRLGFERQPLHQLWMLREFAAPG